MSDLQKQQGPILDALEAAFVALVIKAGTALGEAAIKALFHKHKDKIIAAAIPVTEDLFPCPPGFIRDPRSGECVTDPGK